MENKKISLSFGIVTITFLLIFFILINDFKAKREHDLKTYAVGVAQIVKEENAKIRSLSAQLADEQKQNNDLKNTLAETRNQLDALSKKLAPSVAAVPVAAAK